MTGRVESRFTAGISTVLVALGLTVSCGTWFLGSGIAEARDGTVRVDGRGDTINDSVTVRLADVDRDINNRPYQTRSGETRLSGSSLERVLQRAAADSGGWLELGEVPNFEIALPNAGVVTLSPDQALTQAGFPDGPPLLWRDGSDTVLFLPGRTASTAGAYHRYRSSAVPIRIGKGEVYDLDVSPASIKVDRGDRVAFTARVSNPAVGDSLGYRWSVQGVTKASGPGSRFSWTFRREGTFSVFVTVSGKRGSRQADAVVTVGNPPDPPKPKDPPGSSNTPQPFVPTPGGVAGSGGSGGGLPGAGGFPGLGEGLDVPIPPQPGAVEPESDLPLVSGELIGPDTEITEIEPGTEAGPTDQEADESGGFGLPGEAWTLFGVGLLVGLGGLIELRVFSRIG